MKKLINDPQNVVREQLEGIEQAHADLVRVSYEPNFIVRADAPVQGKVGIVSGVCVKLVGGEPVLVSDDPNVVHVTATPSTSTATTAATIHPTDDRR